MKKETTRQARVAQNIRKELGEKFPGTKFSVRAAKASLMSEVIINWAGGPSKNTVEEVVNKYEYYGKSSDRGGIEQVTFVSCMRSK